MDQVRRGFLAGLAGTAAMTIAQTKMPKGLLSKLPSGYEPSKPRFPMEPEAKNEPATEVVARRALQGIAHRRVTERQRKWAGQLVHFGTGAAWGGLFGLLARRRPKLRHGLAWGAAVWVLNDNLLVPLLRLGDWPRHYPIGVHLSALLAHLAYGAGTAAAYRLAAGSSSI